jgi:prepilin-type N-terminal cleavage/methylation domain-containing protein
MQIERAGAQAGFTLIETLIAMLVLTVGAIGMASAFLYGMNSATSAPFELIATQKAAEAVESVFSARDSQTISWDMLKNVDNEDPENEGIFTNGQMDLLTPGEDGLIGTADDGGEGESLQIENWKLPGDDGLYDTADDVTMTLTNFKREITITDINSSLRQITVEITYPAGGTTRTYTLTALISAFA